MRMFAIAALIACVALATTGYASAGTTGTPLDHTHWQNKSCHFQEMDFLTADAVTPVTLNFPGDVFGWDESYSVLGSTVRIYRRSSDHEKDSRNDLFTGTFHATTLTGTHAWTDEGGSHTENCTYTRTGGLTGKERRKEMQRDARRRASEEHLRRLVDLKKSCFRGAGQAQIDACTRMIQSKSFRGDALTDAFFFRGSAYYLAGQYRQSVDDNTQVIARKSNFMGAYSIRGLSYLYLQHPQLALQDFRKVIALTPKPDAGDFTSRGLAYTQLKQYKKAIADFDRGISLKPTSVTYNNRGYCYFQLGQFKRAIEDYDRAIEMAPNSAGVLYIRGIAKLRSNDKTGGNADIAKAMALDPAIAKSYAAIGLKP